MNQKTLRFGLNGTTYPRLPFLADFVAKVILCCAWAEINGVDRSARWS